MKTFFYFFIKNDLLNVTFEYSFDYKAALTRVTQKTMFMTSSELLLSIFECFYFKQTTLYKIFQKYKSICYKKKSKQQENFKKSFEKLKSTLKFRKKVLKDITKLRAFIICFKQTTVQVCQNI